MIRTEKAHLIVKASSHPGMSGKQNEDRFGVTAFQTTQKRPTPSLFAVLCDGIGGKRAGEVAAEMGVNIITQHIAESNARRPLKIMEKALQKASKDIFDAAQSDMGRVGMGATCACAWIINDNLYTVNLGDSRIYLLRDNDFMQLTTDHTWLEEAREAGIINDEDFQDHPNAHVIRRYLGSKSPPEPDFRLWYFEGETGEEALKNQGLHLEPGDTILLCSDGLTDLVADDEIREVLLRSGPSEIPEILIDMANQRGGHDNTTVIIIKKPPTPKGLFSGIRKGQIVIGCLLMILLISILITLILIGLRWRSSIQPEIPPTPTNTITLPISAPSITPNGDVEDAITVQAPSPTLETPHPSITPWPTDTPPP